jgi:hypothetical protein
MQKYNLIVKSIVEKTIEIMIEMDWLKKTFLVNFGSVDAHLKHDHY